MGWKLDDQDIADFELGTEINASPEIERVSSGQFNAVPYEIPLDNIEKGEKIGKGEFGEVHKGFWTDNSKVVPCAIKTPKPNSGPEEIQCFFKELKIMAHVGQHPNITRFIGAHTQNLQDGFPYIVMEFCELGSLDNYLTKYKAYFNNQLKGPLLRVPKLDDLKPGKYIAVENIPAYSGLFSTTDLVRWASQIAAGMSHLAQRMVIHGDLAARNVLLDTKRVPKICDFGLSHHLYPDNTNIACPERCLRIHWKWMAVEVLRESEMSTMSDVWSFGVTLWEMFTLGSEPYEKQDWSPAIVNSISIGDCQLQQPEFANEETFKIMKSCWAIKPTERPTFQKIEDGLRGMDMLQYANS